MMEFHGKIQSFDTTHNLVTIRASFLTPEEHEGLQHIIESGKIQKISSKDLRKKSMTYDQQKKFFVDICKILLFFKIDPNPENKRALYEQEKRACFPITYLELAGERIPSIPSITDLSLEELNYAIEKLEERYSDLGVNFHIELEDTEKEDEIPRKEPEEVFEEPAETILEPKRRKQSDG